MTGIVIFNLGISHHIIVNAVCSVNNNIGSFTFWLILLPTKPAIKCVSRIYMNVEGQSWIEWCGQCEAFTDNYQSAYPFLDSRLPISCCIEVL